VLAGEQLSVFVLVAALQESPQAACGLRVADQRRGLRLRRALSGRTGRVDYRKPPSQ